MVDKIVQLVDKDDNNLFPVAGSMKQGAVTTNLLADGAVTKDKIDFSTMKKWAPDYAQKSTTNLLASSTSATVQEDGFINYNLNYYKTGSSPTTVRLNINNKEVDRAEGEKDMNNNLASVCAGTLPVSKGDVISVTTTGSNVGMNARQVFFIPGKWV